MDGVPNVNDPVTYESIKTQFWALPITEKRRKSRNVYDSGAELERAVSDVDISESGRHLQKMHKELENIEDPKARRRAREGFEKVMQYIAGQSDPKDMQRYLVELDEFRLDDKQAFREMFQAAGALIEEGFDMTRWLVRFHGIPAMEVQKAFIRETLNILSSEETAAKRKLEALERFIGMAGERGRLFFEEMAKRSDLEDKIGYMDRFTS